MHVCACVCYNAQIRFIYFIYISICNQTNIIYTLLKISTSVCEMLT